MSIGSRPGNREGAPLLGEVGKVLVSGNVMLGLLRTLRIFAGNGLASWIPMT